jgi:hypothetical protein
LAEARLLLSRQLSGRAEAFLDLLARAVYAQPASPYRALLRRAGCELGDLTSLVQREGVEGALRILLDQGVYLTVAELKGQQPVVRGSLRLELSPRALRNPLKLVPSPLPDGAGAVPAYLAMLWEHAVDTLVGRDAWDAAAWTTAVWAVPGTTSVGMVVGYSAEGSAPARFILQVDHRRPGLDLADRFSPRALDLTARLAGRVLPPAELLPLAEAHQLAAWLQEVLRTGGRPNLAAHGGPAVLVAQAALAAGCDLSGAHFTVGGEPLTARRRAVLEQTGAAVVPVYASRQTAGIGRGCRAPSAPDDLRLQHNRLALIQPGPAGPGLGLPPTTLLFSSLRRSAPLILLNVSLGDQAVLEQRSCGCPLERAGWTTHLHTIRSFEKLTAGGMTFLDRDVVRVLEELLPERFGGGPTDYQLVEDEAADGQPALRLLVNPAVGPLDDRAIADTFLSAIGAAGREMELQWRQGGWLRVERRAPLARGSGKIEHLLARGGQARGAPADLASPTP